MNIFKFEDYKSALNSILFEKRKTQKGVSRKLSEYLGVHPTLVSQVLTGNKDFSEEQLLSVCEYFGIPKIETKFLLALLQRERAGSVKLKEHFDEVVDQVRKQALKVSERVDRDRFLSEEEKSIFYSSWIYSAIHLLSTLDKALTFEEISQKLNLPLSKTREVLDFLVSTKLIQEKDGTFISGYVHTHLEKHSPHLVKHHSNWRLKAIQAAETLTDEELMYSGNFSVSEKDFLILREMLLQTIKEFVKIVKPSPAENIAQFNLDLFWIKN